ncbi:7342_t:CDS:2 [Funneliformis mosseae]|uniref:7342_t:CDS:1 n=1 Tax=Funneliformis mosseae TaxID=27381 RepID=A0A9N9GBK4_FUNMO|nr:7342_t:CDS:2 [Funneliformis mosseae]
MILTIFYLDSEKYGSESDLTRSIPLRQIKASQDTKPSNHNYDIIETPIIKEQEVLEPISYPENSTLYNNLQNDLGSHSRRNHSPLKPVPLRMI